MWLHQSVLYRKRVWCWVLLACVLLVKLAVMRDEYCFQSNTKLGELLVEIHGAMEETGVEYWLDFGTLLGVIRENTVLEHEYDVDIGVAWAGADVLATQKHIFKKHGLTLYTRGDYISSKSKLTYDTQEGRLLFSSPFISSPCLRVYNEKGFFCDMYCYSYVPVSAGRQRVEAAEFIRLPRFDKSGGKYEIMSQTASDMVCDDTCVKKEIDEKESCQLAANVYPLQRYAFLGKEFYIPNNPVAYLKEYYGESWRVSITKGVRGPVCYLQM